MPRKKVSKTGPKKARLWEGNAPNGDGWMLYGSIRYNEVDWRVYYRRNNSEWLNVKLAASGYAERKANYWLGFRPDRTARIGDAFVLFSNDIDLAKLLLAYLKEKNENVPDIKQCFTALFAC